jgi:hypothetical protein
MAADGKLDHHAGERLLSLSFFPAGTVVELADGAIGTVVAVPLGRRDSKTSARQAVALLVDYQGQCLPFPRHIDLNVSEGSSIVRSLTAAERRKVLGEYYPEYV